MTKGQTKTLDPTTEEQAKSYYKIAKARRDRMLKSLGPNSGKTPRQIRRGTRQILRDKRCIFASMVEVARKRRGYATPILPLISKAAIINMWAQCAEPVKVKKKESYSPKGRCYFTLGMIEATRNHLLLLLLRATTELLPTQFMSSGGLPAFDQWLKTNLPNAKFVFTTDIPSYFNLVRRSSVLSGLPHLRRVIERALFDVKDRGKPSISGLNDNLSKVHLTNITSFAVASSPGRGLPQGAAGASIASELVIKVILQSIAKSCPGIQCAAHGDNLIFLVNEEKSLPSLKHALDVQIGSHVGFDVIGELARRNTITSADEKFFFCGSWYQLHGDALKKWPDELQLGNFAVKIESQLGDAQCLSDLYELEKRVKGWMVHYKHSSKAIMLGGEVMSQIGEFKANMAKE